MAIAELRPETLPTGPPVTDADRMAAKGVPIKLDDGSEVRIRFDMEALKELEKNFGPLDDVVDELNREGFGPSKYYGGRGAMETLTYLLQTTLLHYEWEDGIHKYPGKAEQLSHRLDSAELLNSNYLTALNQAMIEALPPMTDEERAEAMARRAAKAADPNSEGSRASSPGNGSTPTPSEPAVAIGSSGG